MKIEDFSDLRSKVKNYFNGNEELSEVFEKCFFNTLDTTCKFENDGSVFVLTGDIPAMWLRDSSAQVMQYLYFLDDSVVRALFKGVLKRQFQMICIDPYANAFKCKEDDWGQWDGLVKSNYLPKIVWERKFEVDSLCYPLSLIWAYYKKTNDASVFDELFLQAFDIILETFEKERKHSERSEYFFFRKGARKVEDVGKSDPEGEKGLIWSGFRPSDDECMYHYHIPDNMFAVSVLTKLGEIFKETLNDCPRAERCLCLAKELKELIECYGIVELDGKKIYVSETDCLGNYHINDDANIPSLLSIPYLEYPFIDKEIYANTRKLILSKRNEYYYEGKILKGIGSPHTPQNRVWPLSIAMQGITSEDEKEIRDCLEMLIASTDGTGYMHEGVDVDDVSKYSRSWFAWANSMFAYFLLNKREIIERLV